MNYQNWHYVDANNQKQGPYTSDQLQTLAAQGTITPTSQVWAEGLENWIQASTVDGLFPAPAAQASAYAPPASDPTQSSGDYPTTIISGASFGKFCSLLIGGFVSLIAGVSLIAQGGDIAMLGMFLAGVGYIAIIAVSVLPYIYIYKAWKCLQPGGATVTPGKAVGFMFIPFFNIYWLFVAFGGLPRQWNEIMDRYDNTQNAPRLTIGAFVCYLLLPLIGIFIWVNQITKGLNYMANIRMMTTTGSGSAPAGSSLNFGPTTIPSRK